MALLFDMDGVIIDSMDLHTETWQVYVEQQGWRQENIAQRMLGKRNDQILRDFFGDVMTDDEVFAHGAAKEALFRERMLPLLEDKLIPGLRQFLQCTADIPCGLATNAELANLDFVLDRAGIRQYFDALVDGHQVEHPKPAPDVYLEAARRLGVEPRNCVIFEDSPSGLAAAQAAGGRVVCIETSVKQPPQAALSIPDFLDARLEPWLVSQQPVTK